MTYFEITKPLWYPEDRNDYFSFKIFVTDGHRFRTHLNREELIKLSEAVAQALKGKMPRYYGVVRTKADGSKDFWKTQAHETREEFEEYLEYARSNLPEGEVIEEAEISEINE